MLAGISVRGIEPQFVPMLIVMKNHVSHCGSLIIGSLFLMFFLDLDSQTPVSGSMHVDFCLSIGFVDKELLND